MTESRQEVIPSRIPGEGGIELEAMSGDLQLRRPRTPPPTSPTGRGTAGDDRHAAGHRRATEEQRRTIYRPSERAPVSGVYDLVDENGHYLRHQVTCHEGSELPPTRDHKVRDRKIAYGYMLAYEAAHLGSAEDDATPPPIRWPGELVPDSGVYGVVDRDGSYLRNQRALVASETFPELDGPAAHGYVLQYRAAHLARH